MMAGNNGTELSVYDVIMCVSQAHRMNCAYTEEQTRDLMRRPLNVPPNGVSSICLVLLLLLLAVILCSEEALKSSAKDQINKFPSLRLGPSRELNKPYWKFLSNVGCFVIIINHPPKVVPIIVVYPIFRLMWYFG